MVRSSLALPRTPSSPPELHLVEKPRQRLAALLELLLREVWESEEEAEGRRRGGRGAGRRERG